ncbi:Acid phosphatase [Kluyveromyces marxianus]
MKNLLFLALFAVSEGSPLYNSGFSNLNSDKIGKQEDIFPYLAGAAPYYKYPKDYGIELGIPENCQLKQVQLIARHGERYPSKGKAKTLATTWAKLQNYTGQFNGSLSFLNDDGYVWFMQDTSQVELETTLANIPNPLNPYTGEEDAKKHARRFASLYGDLFNTSSNIEMFTSSSRRVHDTAVFFAEELDHYVNSTHLNIISENTTSGVNTLVPGTSCITWDSNENATYVSTYSEKYLDGIAERLNNENKEINLNLTKTDANNLFAWCAYEINVKGFSDICDVFTKEELIRYTYEDDLVEYYQIGPGNSLSKTIGSVFFNASVELLKQSEELDQKVWLSFTHDGDMVYYLDTIGLFDNGKSMNASSVEFLQHNFRRSWMTPMGARLYTEKFQCSNETYVRYTLNDAVIPIESCSSGPGFSCPEKEFYSYAEERLQGLNYVESCNITSISNQTSLTFYWDYTKVNYTAPLLLQ